MLSMFCMPWNGMEYSKWIILLVYCALGFGLGRFSFQSGPYARGVQVSSGFAPSRARGISSFAPLCGLLRGDFRAFPAGVILSPLCLWKRASRPLRGNSEGRNYKRQLCHAHKVNQLSIFTTPFAQTLPIIHSHLAKFIFNFAKVTLPNKWKT